MATQVLEHVHPSDVDAAIGEITRITRRALFIGIAYSSSIRGGVDLHLTKEPQARGGRRDSRPRRLPCDSHVMAM